MTTVAILGARGQIARGLVKDLPQAWVLELFSRNPQLPHREATERGARIRPYEVYASGAYDLVINAAGRSLRAPNDRAKDTVHHRDL